MNNLTFYDTEECRTRKIKGWLRWLTFCVMLLVGQMSVGQTVQIGSGNTTTPAASTTVPITNYNFSYCQMIVTAAQITAGGGDIGEIQKLRFYNNSLGTTSVWTGDWTVFLGNTAKTSFSSNTDWVALADLQQVYQGSVSPILNDWWEITFTTPFNYTGGNLIVAIDENTPGWTSVPSFLTFTSGSDTAILYRTDNAVNNPDPANPPLDATGGLLATTGTLPQMQFYFTEDCPSPSVLTATNFTSESAELGWQENGSATSWDIEWGVAGFTPTGTPTISGVTNPYTLNGLDPYTEYLFYVRADCGIDDGLSVWSGPFSFQTAADCSDSLLDITSTTGDSVCNEGNITLQATASGTGQDIFWYDAPTGGNLVGQGPSFDTPFLTETTSYWATEVLLENEVFTEQGNLSTTTLGSTTNGGIEIILNQTASIISFEARSTTAAGGAVTYALIDINNGNSVLMTHNDTLPGGGTGAAPVLYTVNLNFLNIPPGNYRLIKQSGAASAYMTGAFPYPLGNVGQVVNGAGSTTTTSTLYYHFFNITVEGFEILCESDREEVIATVHEIIDIDVTATETTIEPGDSTTLSVSSTNTDYIYEWNWNGGTSTGTSLTVSPIEHTTYTVIATDTITGCQNESTIEILVYDMTLCDTIEILSTTDGSVCDEGTVTLNATASGTGDNIYWYNAPTGGNLVGQGPTFTTPVLTETTSYWASEVYLDGEEFPGQGVVNDFGTSSVATTRQGMVFEVFENMTLVDVEVYSTGAGGTMDIELYDNSNLVVGNHLYSVTTTVDPGTTTAPSMHKITLNFELTPGTYRIVRAATPTVPLRYISGAANFGGGYPIPFDNGLGQIVTGANNFTGTLATAYYYFFNWTISSAITICESEREEVIASVHETIDIDVTATATDLLPGESSTLSASSTNSNYEYVWTWDGGTATGATVTVTPTSVSTIYTVTATDTVTGCVAQESIEIFTFDIALCDDLGIASTTDGNICGPGTTTTLEAIGASDVTDSKIYWYNAPTGGNLVGQGTSFTTPILTETTSFWASEVLLEGGQGTLPGQGKLTYTGTAPGGYTLEAGLQFVATEAFTLISVVAYSNTATGTTIPSIQLRDDSGAVIQEVTNIPIANGQFTPFTIDLNFNIPGPGTYRLMAVGSFSSLIRDTGGIPAGTTYNIGNVGEITSGVLPPNTNTSYYYFYDWTVSSGLILCESDREEVIATVHEIIDIDVTATETTIDVGDSTTLSVSSTNTDYTYEWTWNGGSATGASLTVAPTEHTTYTVTATDTITGCQNESTIEILVYDMTLCNTIEILSISDGSICNEGTAILQATGSGTGDNIYWYDAPIGGNLVGQGASFTTPTLTETTSYWATEVYLDNEIFTEQGNISPTTLGSTTNGGITFVLNQTASIISFEARSTTAAGGAVTYALIDVDNGNAVLMTHNDTLPGGGTNTAPVLYTVNLNFLNIPPGNYRLVKQSGAATAYMTGAFPYPLGTVGQVINGAGSATTTSTLYYHFFNITIEQVMPICESDREEVTATVHNIDITATATTIDPGDSTTLTASSTNPNYTYVWTWDGGTDTGASITVSPTDHTTYTVTATDTTNPDCQNSAEITIIVFNTALCNMLEITSTTDGGICESGTTVLQATGSGTGDNIYWYDAPTGGNLVGQGTSFTTPNLTETSSFWASEVLLEGGIGTISGQGKLNYTGSTPGGYTLEAGLQFVATEAFTLISVVAYSNTATGTTIPSIQLRDDSGAVIQEVTNIPIANGQFTPFTIDLNFNIPGPGTYRLMAVGSFSSLIRDTGGIPAGTTYNIGNVGEITSGVLPPNTNTSYYYFYDWTVSSGLILCESDREEVIATVVPQSTTPIPTGDSNQLVPAGTTLAGLNVTGTNLTWYSDAALTNQIADTTLAYEGTYYVTQTIGYCEGLALAITVTLQCPTPNNLSTGTVTFNSAELLWQGNGASFDIEWGLEGFTLGNGTEINNITTNTHLLNGLTSDTYYDFYVRQDCEDDGISNWGGPYTFFTGYCVVTSTSTTYGISNFSTSGGVLNINNSSGAGSYSNYTVQSVAQFEGGAPVEFTITSANGTTGMGIWIDWNNNMVFDPGEHVYNSAAYISVGTGSITIPAGTPVGSYRMRVVANWSATNPTPCGFLGSTGSTTGEAEDYTFMVIDPPACMPPIELTADVTAISADLGWTSTGTLFDIKWGAPGFDVNTQGTIIEGVANPYSLLGLDPSTTYQYYVRRDCTADDDGYSLWAGPFTFTTLCVPVSVLNENFDGVTAGTTVLPVCWSKIGTSAAYVSTTTPFSAPNNLYMYKSTNVDNYLVTPYLDNLADNTHWLKFRARTTSTSSTTLTVGYLTDATDPSTFVEIETITFVGTTYPSEDFIIFPWNLPVNAKHLAFRNNTNLRTIYLDDIRWEAAPTCMYPMNLTSSNSSVSSTVLSWAGTGTLYDIEYGPAGFTPGTGTTIPGVGNPYVLSELTSGVNYAYYVRQDCGDGDYSDWAGPHTFVAGAYVGDIPTLLNTNPQVDDFACATSFSIEVPEGYFLSALSVEYVMLSIDPAWTSHQRSVLYSPTLEMGEDAVVTGGVDNYPGMVSYNREVTFANGATGTIEFALKAWRTSGGTGCGTAHVYVLNGSWVLHPEFELIPSCPNPPADLGYTNITETSVDLTWTAEPGTFQVQWGDVGFNPTDELGTIISDITSNTYTIDGLDSSIPYEFYVRRDCSTDDVEDFGAWVGPFRFNSGYCLPSSPQAYYFSQFNTTGALENIVFSYPGPNLGVGYKNNTDMIVTQDAGASFDFTSNYVGGASGLRIWVDWNNNLIFEDEEEVFYLGSGSGNKTGTIAIPEDAVSGTYRMRIRAQQGATSIPPACGSINTGEAIDFTLQITCNEIPSPIGFTEQEFTEGQTLADLDVTGDNLVWYADEDLTIILEDTTLLVDQTTYYVVSTDGNCQSDVLVIIVEEVLSTPDFGNFGFVFYPNPVGEMLYLRANTEISHVIVFNMLGQQLNLPVQSGNTQIDMTGLPAGNYVLRVTIEGINKTFKVIKK